MPDFFMASLSMACQCFVITANADLASSAIYKKSDRIYPFAYYEVLKKFYTAAGRADATARFFS